MRCWNHGWLIAPPYILAIKIVYHTWPARLQPLWRNTRQVLLSVFLLLYVNWFTFPCPLYRSLWDNYPATLLLYIVPKRKLQVSDKEIPRCFNPSINSHKNKNRHLCVKIKKKKSAFFQNVFTISYISLISHDKQKYSCQSLSLCGLMSTATVSQQDQLIICENKLSRILSCDHELHLCGECLHKRDITVCSPNYLTGLWRVGWGGHSQEDGIKLSASHEGDSSTTGGVQAVTSLLRQSYSYGNHQSHR